MKTTVLMPEESAGASLPPWKQKLLQARQMRDNARAAAYDRVRLLSEVYEDSEFRLEFGNRSTEKIAAILDDYVDDLDYDFLELHAVLRHFPDRADWEKTKISRLYQQVVDAGNRQAAEDKPPRIRTTPTPTQLKQTVEALNVKVAQEQAKRKAAEDRIEEIRRHADETPLPITTAKGNPKPANNQNANSNGNGHVDGIEIQKSPRDRTLEGIARVRETAQRYEPYHEVFGRILKLLSFAEAEFHEPSGSRQGVA
jgi:hypothetical protein